MMLMSFARRLALAMGAFVLLAGTASAQGDPSIFRNKSVQKELKFTPIQLKKLDAFFKELEQRQQKAEQKFADASPQERDRLMGEVVSWSRDQIDKIVKPEQIKRLKQIELQKIGFKAMRIPQVQAELKLTKSQKEKVVALFNKGEAEFREGITKGSNDVDKLRKDIDARTSAKIFGLLSAEQKSLWKDVLGAPFEVKPDDDEPGTGPGPRNRPRRGRLKGR